MVGGVGVLFATSRMRLSLKLLSIWIVSSLLVSVQAFSFLGLHASLGKSIASVVETRLSASPPEPSSPPEPTAKDDSKPPSKLAGVRMELKLHTAIDDILAEDWNVCAKAVPANNETAASPFLEHAWMHALEESNCASTSTGWVPQHLSIHWNGKCRGYVPLYIKGHSMGEFIFDNTWAEAAYQNNIDYYPKLLVAVPFTPATGSRILWHPDVYATYSESEVAELRVCVGAFLIQLAEASELSSVHCNFLTDQEATDMSHASSLGDKGVDKNSAQLSLDNIFGGPPVKDDYLRRTSLQYHWSNSNPNNDSKPFESFDDYLGCFKSKRRINIRRERRKVLKDEKIRIQAVTGREILKYEGLVLRMFEIYLSTIEKMYYGRQYLTFDFFERLAKSDFIDNLCFMCARYESSGEELKANDVFAGTFNVVKDGIFYGRYWGCLEGAEVKNLHFEVCYWSAIDYCIEHGFKRMEPGAGGGDYKWARG